MTLLIVTTNQNKFLETKEIAGELEQVPLKIPEIRGTLEEVAVAKARFAFEKLRKPLVCDDSGFFVDALNGFPGAYSHFVLDKIGCEGIVKLALGSPAQFRTVAVYFDGKPSIARGAVSGQIVQPRGSSGFGFDPIFMPDGHDKTFAEDFDYKLKNSHRKKAFEKLFERIRSASSNHKSFHKNKTKMETAKPAAATPSQ